MNRYIKLVAIGAVLCALIMFGVLQVFAAGGFVYGGGQIVEVAEGLKRQEWMRISFGGWAEGGDYNNGSNNHNAAGEWEINFHNVGVDELDRTKFHSTEVTELNFFPGNSNTCDSAMNLTLLGEWNHQPGYKVILRAGDLGSPGFWDTVRVSMLAPSGATVYDTDWPSEFSPESSCVGTARTGLDSGNVSIELP